VGERERKQRGEPRRGSEREASYEEKTPPLSIREKGQVVEDLFSIDISTADTNTA